jgi:hypothetical protein
MVDLLKRGVHTLVHEWNPEFGGIRVEHRLRCTLEQLLEAKFMQHVLQFVSIRGTNAYVAARYENTGSAFIPRFLVRGVPLDPYVFQATHFLRLLEASLDPRPKAAMQPVQQFLFAWASHCTGFVTGRWLKATWYLLRSTPAVWHYINGVRDVFKLPPSSFTLCAQRLRVAGFKGAAGQGPLAGIGAKLQGEEDAPVFGEPEDTTMDGTLAEDDEDYTTVAPQSLQPGVRVRTNQFRNGSTILPDHREPVRENMDCIDVTDWMEDVGMQAKLKDFEERVHWDVQGAKSQAVQDSPFGGHQLRALRDQGCVLGRSGFYVLGCASAPALAVSNAYRS